MDGILNHFRKLKKNIKGVSNDTQERTSWMKCLNILKVKQPVKAVKREQKKRMP